ncbi:MAG: choice-of-anchor N protein [Armatimonadetes bacterium]|nr:choice-of-anchor N protein [Armatimonadota bacterium]
MRMANLLLLASLVIVAAWVSKASAIPTLQLYIEGATYDPDEETWVIYKREFVLWVIGDVQKFGTIYDVKLAAAVKSNETGSISLTPTKATIAQVQDRFVPPPPTPTTNFPSPDGAIPRMGNGRNLPTHGVYGPGVRFYEWLLGDFSLRDDARIGDFSYGFPSEFPRWGQINAYLVKIKGFSWVHFDAYDHVVLSKKKVRYVFAPFSHDALHTPEPGSLILFLAGGAILLRMRKRNFKA